MPRRGDAVPEFSAKPGTDGGPAGGFVDIDEALMEDVEDLEEPTGGGTKRRCGASRRFQASKKKHLKNGCSWYGNDIYDCTLNLLSSAESVLTSEACDEHSSGDLPLQAGDLP